MRRSHPDGPVLALLPANDNGAPIVADLPTPLARRGTRLCGTAIALPPGALDELRNLNAHRIRYAEALQRLAADREAFRELLAEFR
ncbi:hypothetical protein DLJ53_17145 [Acuticoccus sediminis]|uniref:Uncharacterized protein n=1 Tax=Acuticoccus sediminis TaxID=2184697 RepID=A0A8B2NU02_9HYPH|nr:hypothetical protein [Acuticoccus sediminis]RAI00954.1 hypothetical protein DLJ53_17145 [Acuticoccus sediminis]